MGSIIKRKVQDGLYWVDVPDADLRILCGCPADSIKHLAVKGLLPVVNKDGVEYQQGPNAILLSDILVQNGSLSNMAEFPAYHMFYQQGMIFPDHPNHNKRFKPLIIGKKEQVDAQMEYIYRGNYGLTCKEEFLSVRETEEFAEENLRMKLRYAPDAFLHTRDLMEPVYLARQAEQIRPGTYIKRVGENRFKISRGKETVTIDLNLKKNRNYKPTFGLPKVRLSKHYFAVIHSGEGDGWNKKKPSVSSIIQFDNKHFLIDAGPFILKVLKSFSLKAEQLEGIFVTHVHDDHFAGLYDLMNQNRRLKIYSTPVVGSTVVKKMSALLSKSETEIKNSFDFQYLDRDRWNKFQGLEVKPIATAHPVDTTILIFRVKDQKDYRTYGHYSDIAALSWLKSMIVNNDKDAGVSQLYYNATKKIFNLRLDVKKIDVGGPTIHGNAEDFVNDKTKRIILCHTHQPFTKRQLEVGREVDFGDIEVLIDKKPV